jgi:O-antigen/teichoic acid export membrane protein
MADLPSASIVRRVLAGAGWMMGWRMISRLLGFVSVLILARLLAPADFGIVAIATSVTAAIEGLSQFGVRDALVRLHDESKAYYDTAFTFQAVRGLVTGTLIAGLSWFAGPLLGEARLTPVLLVLAGSAVVAGWENIGVVRFSRELDFRMQVLLQAGPRLLGFVLTTTLAVLLRSYWALVWGAVAVKLAGVAMSYAVSAHRPGFSLRGWRYLLGFSVWTWASGLAIIVWTRSEPFLLGPALGPAMLGVYMIGVEIAILPISELVEPASAALFPGFAMAQRRGSETVAMGMRVGGALALCAAPLSLGVSACSGFLVAALLGPAWQAAQPVIAILAWLCLFSPYSFVCGNVLSAKGLVRRVFYGVAAAAALKVAALLLVRPTGNLKLIALASVLVVAAESGIFIWQLRAAGGGEVRRAGGAMLRLAAASAASAGLLYATVPGAWQVVALARVPALAAGAATGLLGLAVFAAAQAMLWLACGQPPGPEALLLETLRGLGAFRRAEARWLAPRRTGA